MSKELENTRALLEVAGKRIIKLEVDLHNEIVTHSITKSELKGALNLNSESQKEILRLNSVLNNRKAITQKQE